MIFKIYKIRVVIISTLSTFIILFHFFQIKKCMDDVSGWGWMEACFGSSKLLATIFFIFLRIKK
jgi:hypothetical protein